MISTKDKKHLPRISINHPEAHGRGLTFIVSVIPIVYPSQNETGAGCLSKSLWSHIRNMLPPRFEIRVSFWNGYITKFKPVFVIQL